MRGFALARLREARCCSGFSCYVAAQGPIFNGVAKGNGPTPPLYTSPCRPLRLYVLHPARCTPHNFYIPGFTFYTLHPTRCATHSAPYILHITLSILHSGLYSLHFTFRILHPALHAPRFTLNTLHSLCRAQHSTLRFSSTLYIPRATLHT